MQYNVWFKSGVDQPPSGKGGDITHVLFPTLGVITITANHFPTTGLSRHMSSRLTGYHRVFRWKNVMSPPFPEWGVVNPRFEPHISIATLKGRHSTLHWYHLMS